ncbi:MAG TPA: adenylate/guanylate cyclase domain-containing protein [Verrucomicrobiae bacterium]|nr:adenylate/guanylate cyclase domain-containing protein [Verrucomicrobiae bacterium]
MAASTVRMLFRLGISAFVFLVFMLHTSRLWPSTLLTTIENVTYDSRVRLTMPGTVDPRVVIIDIDDKSLAAEGQFPWPRDKLAKLVTTLFDTYKIRVIGFDMTFPEPDRTSAGPLLQRLAEGPLADLPGYAERVTPLAEQLDNDRIFADALRGRPVVAGYAFLPGIPQPIDASVPLPGPALFDRSTASQYAVDFFRPATVVANLPALREATSYAGFFDIPSLDDDGIARDVPLVQLYGGQVFPSLAFEVLRVAAGYPGAQLEFEPAEARLGLNLERVRFGDHVIPVDQQVALMVPYRGRERSFPYIPATDVLQQKADPGALAGAIAFLGTSAAGLKDLRATPVGAGYPGVEVHANIVSGVLDGRVKQRAPYYGGMEAVILLVLAVLLAWLFPKFSPLYVLSIALGLIAAGVATAFYAWSSANIVMPMGVPIVFTLVVFLAQLLYGYFVEARRSRDISRRFGEYVPPEIVEEMAANPGAVSMEGKSKEMTVLFSDVRGFTTISEQFKDKPQELSELMNQFLTPLTKVIQKHRGTIDKYMGDAIMAFWGAPLDDPKHAENALVAALELPKAIRALDAEFAKRGWPSLKIGVGLSTGNMRVGNMGSEFRRAYTVMGDPVNLGARIEGLTKEYGVAVICSEFTRNAGPADWSYRELDQVKVVGKDQPVSIYEPMGSKDQLDPQLRQDLARHRGALKLYRSQHWEQAEAEFFSLSRGAHKHRVYELMLERIAHYRKNPPGPKWDGVWTFTTK